MRQVLAPHAVDLGLHVRADAALLLPATRLSELSWRHASGATPRGPPFETAMVTVELFASQRIEQHALFRLLEADGLTVGESRAVGLDIFHVVDAFPRFLAAVLTHISDYRERMNLVENLYAEHGRMREEHVHVVTYRSFLHALGLSDWWRAASRTSGSSRSPRTLGLPTSISVHAGYAAEARRRPPIWRQSGLHVEVRGAP